MKLYYRQKLYAEKEEQFNLPIDVVYYIESEWDYKVNDYVLQHRQELEHILNEEEHLLHYKLCYIHRDIQNNQLQDLFPMSAVHPASQTVSWFPHITRWCKYKKGLREKKEQYNRINSIFRLRFLTHLMPNQVGEKEHLGFFAFDTEGIDVSDIEETLRKYIAEVEKYNHQALTIGIEYPSKYKEHIQFHIVSREEIVKKDDADDQIDFSIVRNKAESSVASEPPQPPTQDMLRALAEKIKLEIDELQRQNGINILTELLSEEHKALIKQPIDASRMIIDDKFRIWLEDYNNLEIKMPTLCKAVYFLFMNHPEGVFLKEIGDYKTELQEIYMTISLRTNLDKMEQSIDDLVDVTSDSLQQKLSKIAAAFRKDLAADYARLYTINGKRGEAYGLTFSRGNLSMSQELKDLFARLQK